MGCEFLSRRPKRDSSSAFRPRSERRLLGFGVKVATRWSLKLCSSGRFGGESWRMMEAKEL